MRLRQTTENRQLTTLLHRAWSNDWFRAFLLALCVLVLLHLFVFRFVSVQSTSMFATLRPDDLLLVARWPKWTGFERGDIIVFRDPTQDRTGMSGRSLLVKRIMAVPGDELEIRNGVVYVNGMRVHEEPGISYSHLARLKQDASREEFLRRWELPEELAYGNGDNVELPLTREMAARMSTDPQVMSVVPMRLSSGARRHIFPFSPRYPWNGDDYGPVVVPGAGDTLRINVDNLPLYDRVMSAYEGHRLGAVGNELTIDDAPLREYVVEQDYYFVMGDCRHFSADSRYWGFLPADHAVGCSIAVLGAGGSR